MTGTRERPMLINCAAYQEGSKLGDIPIAAISDYLQQPGCFVWVALLDATNEELKVMQEEFSLHELAVEDARHGHQRPKIEEYGDSVFAVRNTTLTLCPCSLSQFTSAGNSASDDALRASTATARFSASSPMRVATRARSRDGGRLSTQK